MAWVWAMHGLLLAQQGNAGQPGAGASLLLTMAPFILIFILFYVMLVRPERKKRAALERMLAQLKKNDRVVTIGGIHGTVVQAVPKEETVVIRVDDKTNTRLRILRSAIARVITDKEEQERKQAAEKAGAST